MVYPLTRKNADCGAENRHIIIRSRGDHLRTTEIEKGDAER
jgi:hypothetical protein